MARALRLEYEGAIWHITSRGNERRAIFRDDRDREFFIDTLAEVVALSSWRLHAWVLMRNHAHLLVETPRVPTISRGMKRLNETYAQWFNVRHRRVGHLFQGRFKGIVVERESHLLELTRYIVLNPVRCGAARFAGDWRWSNYRATAGLVTAPEWLELDWTLAQFDPRDRVAAHDAYRRFVADGRGASYNPWESLVGQIFLGGSVFCERMQELIDARPRSREHPRAQRRVVTPTFDRIIDAVVEAFDLRGSEELRRKSRGAARKAFADLAWKEGGVTLAAIGEWMGVTPGAVAKMIRVSESMEKGDAGYRGVIGGLRNRLRA